MSRRRTTVIIDNGQTSASSSSSFDDEGDLVDSPEYSSRAGPDDHWGDDYGDLEPSDSASASQDVPPRPHSARPTRSGSRRHRIPHQRQSFTNYRVPPAPMSVEPSEEYSYQQPRYGHGPPPAPAAYYGARGGAPPQPGYPQSHAGGFMPPTHFNGQMVPYNNFQNPFAPMANGGGADYFNGPPRGPYDMMNYGGHQGQNGYFGGQTSYGALPPHLQQYMYSSPPPAAVPATEVGAPPTPAPPEKKDPVVEAMKAELELFKKDQAKKAAAEAQKELEEKIRRDTEAAIQRRLEDVRKAQEDAQKEIAKAKIEAERAARQKLEDERKAEEERRRQHEEAMKRAERDARDKMEAEFKAMEERKKREAEAAAAAEAAAKIKIETAMRMEAEAKAAAEKKAAEEVEWRKKLEAEAKLKAEIEAREKLEKEVQAAADAKKAEEEKKKAEEAFKKRALEEAKEKVEEAAKKAEKAPIKFKDAVGRKFSFPYRLCQTWPGMEELIKQAFLHVEVIGPHVQEGHYDLIGPNGEIILPSVWEKVVQPDWAITMHMWPMDKNPLRHHPGLQPGPHGIPMRPGVHPGHAHPGRPGVGPFPGMRPPNMRPGGGPVPQPPPGWARQHPPPGGEGRGGHAPVVVQVEPRKKSSKGSRGMLDFLAGKPVKGQKKKRPSN